MKINLDSSYNFLIPYNEPVVRIGNNGDGGYVIPVQALDATSLVSAGIEKNWTFEEHWLSLNPRVNIHAYDGYVNTDQFEPTLKEQYNLFFKNNVKHIRENISLNNIGTILKQAGPKSFLKLDIEGDEYKVMPYICKVSNLIGMAIEFHNLDFEDRRLYFKSTLAALNDNYNIVHIHANNYCGLNQDYLPHTLEISFLRKDLCSSNEKRYDTYLPGIDFPNGIGSEEYMLYFDSGE